jgi:hypothetical protein
MFSGKLRSEKVETIKRLIRQNNYIEYQKTYEQCLDLGLSVNLTSLSRFSEKLKLLDRADRSKRLKKSNKQEALQTKQMTYEQVKQRETEITFELGKLKIKENKLLEELNSLSTHLLDKH